MKFERPKGFVGSTPRNWIDKNLPMCPLCKKPALWETALEMRLSYNRFHFRCPSCMAILSISGAAIEGATTGLGLTGLLMKKSANKNLKIENVGNNLNLQHLASTEHSLEALQGWMKEGSEQKGLTRQ